MDIFRKTATASHLFGVFLSFFAILLAVFSLCAAPARSQTSSSPLGVPKDLANAHYKDCMASSPSKVLTPQTQEVFCGCASARMSQFFTVKDTEEMKSPSDPKIARAAFDKLLTYIYAPCFSLPAKDYYESKCLTDSLTKRLTTSPKKFCSCVSTQISIALQVYGPEIFKKALQESPTLSDPIDLLEGFSRFQRFQSEKILYCVDQ